MIVRVMAAMLLALAVLAPPALARAEAPPVTDGFAGPMSGGTRAVQFDDIDSLRRCLLAGNSVCAPRRAMTLAPGLRRLMMAGATTLDGRGLLTLQCDSYCLDLRQGYNVVRNVRFVGPGPQRTLWPARFPKANCTAPQVPENLLGCAVPIHLVNAERVLIANNTFDTCGDKCIAIDGGDAITVRNNRFANSYFGVLAVGREIGGPKGRMTVAYNVFTSVFRRSARVSGAFAMHEFGNVLTGACPALPGGGFGPSAVGEAEALVEGNMADPGSCAALEISAYDNRKTGAQAGAGRLRARGNIGIEARDEAVTFSVPYATEARQPGPALRAAVEAAAGVR